MSGRLTNEIADAINKMRNAPDKEIAAAIGIHRHTLTRWKQRGERLKQKDASQLTERDQLFIRVHDSLTTAQVVMMNECVNLIHEAACGKNGVWQAAAWWLERRYPLMFGKKVVFNPNQMEDYLRTHYGEDVTQQVLEVLENASSEQSEVAGGGQASSDGESTTNGDSHHGGHALETAVDAVPRGDSTVPPEQKYAKLET